MSDNTTLPLSAIIFDRSVRGDSDVPVFSNALSQKTLDILHPVVPKEGQVMNGSQHFQEHRDVLSADSSGRSGQVSAGEFAPKTPFQPSKYSFLAEEPILYRHLTDTGHLRAHVAAVAPVLLPRPIPQGVYPVTSVPPIVRVGSEPPRTIEDVISWLQDALVVIDGLAKQGNAHAAILLERIRSILSLITLPSITLPSITLPSISLPNREDLRRRLMEVRDDVRRFAKDLPSFHRIASQVMIACSVALMIMTVGPLVILEGQSWRQKLANSLSGKADDESARIAQVQPTASPTPEQTPLPSPSIPPIDQRFQIVIPKLDASIKVIANVDPANPNEYERALKEGVAHARGTTFPGEAAEHTKTTYIFGHSTNGSWNITRYNALFYNLKDMENGDEISMWFWGKEFHYKVTDKKVVEADDVSYLQPQTDKELLVLQTCWPPGTTWKRLLVIAEPVK